MKGEGYFEVTKDVEKHFIVSTVHRSQVEVLGTSFKMCIRDRYQAFGHHFDFIAIPIIKKRLRMDTSKVILNEARPKLTRCV